MGRLTDADENVRVAMSSVEEAGLTTIRNASTVPIFTPFAIVMLAALLFYGLEFLAYGIIKAAIIIKTKYEEGE